MPAADVFHSDISRKIGEPICTGLVAISVGVIDLIVVRPHVAPLVFHVTTVVFVARDAKTETPSALSTRSE